MLWNFESCFGDGRFTPRTFFPKIGVLTKLPEVLLNFLLVSLAGHMNVRNYPPLSVFLVESLETRAVANIHGSQSCFEGQDLGVST